MGKHNWYECIWEVKHIRNGVVIWQEEKRNALADEGEMVILDSFFRNQSNPSQFYARLCYDTLVETDTLASILNEPTGNGYIPQLIERSTVGFPTLELDLGDYRVITKEFIYTASGGDIGPVNTLYVATTIDNTGKLIGYMPLSMERTILDGDSMTARFRVKLK